MLKKSARLAIAMGILLCGLNKSSAAQTVSPEKAEGAIDTAGSTTPPTTNQTDDSGSALSLGDLARMERAKKETAPKAARVIDDENLPHHGGGISVVGNPQAAAGSGSPRKMTLLDFWASWCGPCRQSIPDLRALQRTYGSDQLEVISVNEDKNENAGRRFASENGMDWEVQFDPQGETSHQYGVQAFPTFILMDSNGREVQRFVGEDPGEPLAGRIAPFMPKAPRGDS